MSIDVAAKLAQGSAAVGAIETYVAASRAVGRPVGGLTVADVRELYAAEAGLRLDALEADSDALAGLADAAEDGMRLEAAAHDAVRQAWQGVSGTAAAEFIERHLAGGAAVVASLREASAALRSLRDQLAGLVEQKVGAAVHFDDRWSAEHPVWLAEAEAVLQGLADDVAVAVVAGQISPYVDGDVQSDWIPAMRDATDSVATAYDGAVARLGDRSVPQFESAGTGSAFGSAVGGWPSPYGSAPPTALPVAPPQQWGPAFSSAMPPGMSGLGGLGDGGLGGGVLAGGGGLAGGLPGLIGRIADVLGSYSGSPDLGAVGELAPPHLQVQRDIGKKSEDGKVPDRAAEQQQEADSETVPGHGDEPVPESPVPAAPVEAELLEAKPVGGLPLAQVSPPVSQPIPPVPLTHVAPPIGASPPRQGEPGVPVPAPPPTPPQPLLSPLAAEAGAKPVRGAVRTAETAETPCSIAADELPQVGQ